MKINKTLTYGLAVLMIAGTCSLTTGCRGTSHSRTVFQGDYNVTTVKKRKPKYKTRSKPIKVRSWR